MLRATLTAALHPISKTSGGEYRPGVKVTMHTMYLMCLHVDTSHASLPHLTPIGVSVLLIDLAVLGSQN